MRILVTGGAGFIGSHTVDALLEQKHDVLVVDNLSTGRREHVPSEANLVVCSVTEAACAAAVQDFAPDAVFHLAAQIDVRHSVADPVHDADVNVVGLVSLAKAAATAGTQTFIFSSSGGAVYGDTDAWPVGEDSPTRAESPYGVSKRCGEVYLDYFARSSGMRGVSLRYGNVYGPRQDPHGEAGVVAIFCQRLLDRRELVVFGDGKQTRDYVHVGDVVAANLAALASEASGALNIGTGVESSVLDLVTHLSAAHGSDAEVVFEPARKGEQRRCSLDVAKAKRDLGWTPARQLADGLEETYTWFRG